MLGGCHRRLELLLGVAGHDEERAGDHEVVHRLACSFATFGEVRQGDFTQVLLGGEAVADEAVADLTGGASHEFADAGEPDVRAAEVAEVALVGREERGHQGVGVELAAELQRFAVLPGVPDGADGRDHLFRPGCGLAPFHGESLGDVGLDLGAEAKVEATLAERLEIPAEVRKQHRVSGEGDGNRCAEFERFGVFGGEHQGQERIVARLGCPDAVVTGRFLGFGVGDDLVDVGAESETSVDLHGACSLSAGGRWGRGDRGLPDDAGLALGPGLFLAVRQRSPDRLLEAIETERGLVRFTRAGRHQAGCAYNRTPHPAARQGHRCYRSLRRAVTRWGSGAWSRWRLDRQKSFASHMPATTNTIMAMAATV